jgi:hypothetical protein
MSWYQENKFAATLLGVTVVVSGALFYLGKSANSDADAARQREQTAVKRINILQAAKPYPNMDNENMLADGLAIFAADTMKFQETMLKFRPEKMQKISANQFSSEVSKYINKLDRYYRSKKIAKTTKKKVSYGMEKYEANMAPEDSTLYLNYQRKALEWLFINLADSGIDSLNNVYRAPVAEILGKAPEQTTRARKKSAKNRNNKPVDLTSVYDGLPIEITFTGTEVSLQKFVSAITAGDEYFFAIKFLKIRNEEQDPVTISSATFPPPKAQPEESAEPAPAGGAGFDLGTGFDLGGNEFAMEADKEIIKQVIGDEKITVFMQLELVLFKEASSVTIPRLKKDKPVKGSSIKVSTK